MARKRQFKAHRNMNILWGSIADFFFYRSVVCKENSALPLHAAPHHKEGIRPSHFFMFQIFAITAAVPQISSLNVVNVSFSTPISIIPVNTNKITISATSLPTCSHLWENDSRLTPKYCMNGQGVTRMLKKSTA